MKKIALFFFVIGMIGCKSDPQSIFTLNGDLWDYDWANTQSHIAILMEEPEKTVIYVIDVEMGSILQTIDMSSYESIANISWTHDDKGLMFLVNDEDGYTSVALTFPIHDHQNIDTVGHLGVYHQTHVIDANSNYLGVLSSGEGHPDVTVYAKNKYDEELFNTDVYPGGIGLIDWVGDTLLVESDMRLDYGLNRADRDDRYIRENGEVDNDSAYEAYSNFIGPLESFSVFKIVPATQEAIRTDIDPFAWEPVSFDQAYKVRTKKVTDSEHQVTFQFVGLK